MNSEELSTIYRRFAEKNINIMQARAALVSTGAEPGTHLLNTKPVMTYVLVAEYAFQKKAYASDDIKLIWPKIAVEGPTLVSALYALEDVVDEIRSQGVGEAE